MIDKKFFESFGNANQFLRTKELITSCTDYLEMVFFIDNLENKNVLWFRGIPQESYDLVPRFQRIPGEYDSILENDLHTKFVLKSKPFIDRENYSRIDWMYLMQHYGLPTRLLDWTEGALIALFFAAKYQKDSTSCVWIMNPGELNKLITGKNIIFVTDPVIMNKDDNVIDNYLKLDSLPDVPIAISPTHLDHRIHAQKSAFTLHGFKYNDLLNTKISERINFYQIRIKSECSDRIRKQLQILGIDESTLFPDLEGISRDIEFSYEIGKERWHLEYEK